MRQLVGDRHGGRPESRPELECVTLALALILTLTPTLTLTLTLTLALTLTLTFTRRQSAVLAHPPAAARHTHNEPRAHLAT